MHDSAKRAIAKFYFDYRTVLDATRVADLGALNINGATKDVIAHAVGFDIVAGKGGDVVIVPGTVPPEHRHQYGAVVTSSSFSFCPDPLAYKKQIIDLLQPGGLLFLTMCSDKCQVRHSTSDNSYGFQDEFRLELRELERFFSTEFEILELTETHYTHPDFILLGKLRA